MLTLTVREDDALNEVIYVNINHTQVGVGELIDLGDDRWAFLRYQDAVCEERADRTECILELLNSDVAQ